MNEKEREVMEQALEALELHAEQYPHMQKGYTVDAVAALRAALAQPVQEPVSKMTTHRAIYFMERFKREEKLLGPNEQAALDFVISMLEKQAEPVEPVGQILPKWSTEKECIDGICAYLNDLGKNLPVNTLLYTAPPQRKPLPLKDVERLIYENTKINPNVADDKELLGYIVNAIRAVERAHNVVE